MALKLLTKVSFISIPHTNLPQMKRFQKSYSSHNTHLVIYFVFCICAFSVSAGCQDSTPKWVGKYQGENKDLVSEELAKENPVIAGTLRQIKLELKSDRTFELIRAGMPTEGNYSISQDTATLTVTKVLGRFIEGESETVKKQNAPISITRKEDGSIILIDPADFGRKPITLKPVTED